MKLKIGNHEATQLRRRITDVGLTQKQLAERISVSERYVREILSTTKTKDISVDKEKVEEMLALLGIGSDYVFARKLAEKTDGSPHLEVYVKKLKSKMYGLLSKDDDTDNNMQIAQYLNEDKAVNKTMGFWHTLIIKTIADKYKVMKYFFDENDFFTIIPKTGYWSKFRHDASQQKNCYFSFKLLPKQKNSTFKLAYTLESPINPGPFIPRKIKIVYGKIEQADGCITVTQFHDTPASYKIKPAAEIIVTTWLDEANHDIIIMSEDDFGLQIEGNGGNGTYTLGVKTKREVRDLFLELGTALFPRNHIFHRAGKHDMGDDPIFFWNNQNFIELNAELINIGIDN